MPTSDNRSDILSNRVGRPVPVMGPSPGPITGSPALIWPQSSPSWPATPPYVRAEGAAPITRKRADEPLGLQKTRTAVDPPGRCPGDGPLALRAGTLARAHHPARRPALS